MFKAIPNQHLTVVDIAALNKQVYALTFAHTYMGSEIKYKISTHDTDIVSLELSATLLLF